MNRKIFTITELNDYIFDVVDNDVLLNNILVTGEVSNCKKYYNTVYFTLKDETSSISVVIFKFGLANILFEIEDGQQLIVLGSLSYYKKSGKLQIICESAEPYGIGQLQLKFEQLKTKLTEEGYFDIKNKKNIPKSPKMVGIITSKTGSVIQDILNIWKRRNNSISIVIRDVTVQGENCENNIIEALKDLSTLKELDLIIIARGGGSLEDLWGFNGENLIKQIYKCKIPIISAVGHETDFTLCDFASDLRASTPSEAAEYAFNLLSDVKKNIFELNYLLQQKLEEKLEKSKLYLSSKKDTFYNLKTIQKNEHLHLYNLLNVKIKHLIDRNNLHISELANHLENDNPLNILKKGYCLANKNNKQIKSVKKINIDDNIIFKFKDGNIITRVIEKKEEL